MVIKTAQAKNEIGELKLKEDLHNRRSMKDRDYSSTPRRQSNFRRSLGTSATRRISTSTSSNMKRRKVMLNIAKYYANEQIENEISVPLERSQ